MKHRAAVKCFMPSKYTQEVVNIMISIQNYWVFGLFPSSGIPENRKHDVSETGSVSLFRRRREKTPTQLGPLERANLNHSF
jgi:hypothetical protein